MGLLAEPRQGVKFAEEGNHRLARAEAGDKGVGDPAGIAGQLKAFRFQRIGQTRSGPEFLKAGFRMVPDIIGNGAKIVAPPLNNVIDKLINVFHYTPRCQGKFRAMRANVATAWVITLSSKSNFSLW